MTQQPNPNPEPEPRPSDEPSPEAERLARSIEVEMECADIWRLTREFLTGELASHDSRRLRAHLDRCGPCRDEYRGAVMTAATIGSTHRQERETRELDARRTTFRALARDLSAGGPRARKNWRLVLYPVLLILLLSHLTQFGTSAVEYLRFEVLEGEVRIAAEDFDIASGVRPLESGQQLRLSDGAHAKVSAKNLRLELFDGARLLIAGQHPLRLRQEAGRAVVRGKSSVVTSFGVIDVLDGAAQIALDGDQLEVTCLEGNVFFVDSGGSREVPVGRTTRVLR
ncbi:MAG: hypothetical protein ACI835_001183 [Planctomycetota bacterium]|jgi:hypothetical protein